MANLPEFIVNHPVLISLFVAITLMLLWNVFGGSMSGIRQLVPAEVTRMLNHEDALVLDLRSTTDYDRGHILGSINVPDADLDTRLEGLQKYNARAVITCCDHGNVSDKAARLLKSNGFTQVYSLKGGITSWRNANLPLTRD